MPAYQFPTSTEVVNLENSTYSPGPNVATGYNFANSENPAPASKIRGFLKGVQDVMAYIKQDDEAFVAPTLLNSWVQFGSGFRFGQYNKAKNNVVTLRGMVRSGTATVGTIIFTLPVGYRPAFEEIFAVVSDDAFGQIRVDVNGNVKIHTGTNAWISFSGISFSI